MPSRCPRAGRPPQLYWSSGLLRLSSSLLFSDLLSSRSHPGTAALLPSRSPTPPEGTVFDALLLLLPFCAVHAPPATSRVWRV
uniref:Uncharacterized protein n=1 Tax=Oryza glumipatula TaxID=40148 RepID=A0A0D9ZAV0_9ORYZ